MGKNLPLEGPLLIKMQSAHKKIQTQSKFDRQDAGPRQAGLNLAG